MENKLKVELTSSDPDIKVTYEIKRGHKDIETLVELYKITHKEWKKRGLVIKTSSFEGFMDTIGGYCPMVNELWEPSHFKQQLVIQDCWGNGAEEGSF